MTISKEIADKVLRADLNNIKTKVKAGKTLTASERAIIAAHAGGKNLADQPEGGRASSKAELARALGLNRSQLQNLEKKEGFPKPDDAGNYDVAACVTYLSGEGVALDKEPGTIGELKAELLKEQIKKLKFQNEVERRKYIAKDEIAKELTRIIHQFKSVLYGALENELPPILEGMKAADIQVRMRESLAEAFRTIETDKWAKASLEKRATRARAAKCKKVASP